MSYASQHKIFLKNFSGQDSRPLKFPSGIAGGADLVAGVTVHHRVGKGKVCRVYRVNPKQSFSLFHTVAHFFEQIQPGAGILRRTRQNTDFIDSRIVNAFHHARGGCHNIAGQVPQLRLRGLALRVNNLVHRL